MELRQALKSDMVHNTLKKLRKGNNSVCYGGCLVRGRRVVGVCVCEQWEGLFFERVQFEGNEVGF